MRAWIEVEWDELDGASSTPAAGILVASAAGALLGRLVDDPDVADPAVTVTIPVPDAVEVVVP